MRSDMFQVCRRIGLPIFLIVPIFRLPVCAPIRTRHGFRQPSQPGDFHPGADLFLSVLSGEGFWRSALRRPGAGLDRGARFGPAGVAWHACSVSCPRSSCRR